MTASVRFPIPLDSRFRLPLLLFGARPSNAYVELRDEQLSARFGFFHFTTPLSNISRWRIEGPWSPITALGVRASIRHHDVTFGGNATGGVRVDFREPVRFLFLRPPAFYLTVGDLDGLAAALAARGIGGEDARRR